MTKTFTWVGASSGYWQTASNWDDLTDGQNPSTIVPGSGDVVNFGTLNSRTGGYSIYGTGQASAATGNFNVYGTLTIGSIDPSGYVFVYPGGHLISGDIGTLDLQSRGGTISLASSEGALNAEDGGFTTTTGNVIAPAGADLSVSGASGIDVGGTTVAPNEIIISAGHTVAPATTAGDVGIFSYTSTTLLVVIDGTLLTGPDATDPSVYNGYVFYPGLTTAEHTPLGTVEGSGSIEVLPNGTLAIPGAIESSALAISVDANATLEIPIIVDGAPTIQLGDGAVFDVSGVTRVDGTGYVISPTIDPATLLVLSGSDHQIKIGGGGSEAQPYLQIPEIEGFSTTDSMIVENTSLSSPTRATLTQTSPASQTWAATIYSGTTLEGTFDLIGDYPSGTSLNVFAGGVITLSTACFSAGTRIATTRGQVTVEALEIGDNVLLTTGGLAPIKWLGHRLVDCRRHPRPWDVHPVRVAAGAFGLARPMRDLWLSPDHAVFLDGHLIPIRYLINGATITQDPVDEVTYWHVELPSHDVILAEGLPAESYLDTGNRAAFANGGGVVDVHPDFARQAWATAACAPLMMEGAVLANQKSRLLARALALGHRLTTDPTLHVFADDRPCPITPDGAWLRVGLPKDTATLRLLSRSWKPAETRPDETDGRCLGIAVANLCFGRKKIALDHPRFASGWHAAEPDWRWTDGDAVLEVSGARRIAFTLAMTGTYWANTASAVTAATVAPTNFARV